MANHSLDKQKRQQWVDESLQAATDLIIQSEDICHQIFSSGKLDGYLTLLSRFHHFDYRNLLLIYHQYPLALCLCPFSVWKNMIDNPSIQVLKDEWKGKGIKLLAPFSDHRGGRHRLKWHGITYYDISQTNVDEEIEMPSPYDYDSNHILFLSGAAQAALAYLFHKSLLLLPKTNQILSSHMPFHITDDNVVMHGGDDPLRRLQVLIEAMGRLSVVNTSIPSAHHILFSQCVSFCLLSIWKMTDHNPPQSSAQISSVPPSIQLLFLDHLQRTVRLIEESVACGYLYLRRETEETSFDIDISALFDNGFGFQI